MTGLLERQKKERQRCHAKLRFLDQKIYKLIDTIDETEDALKRLSQYIFVASCSRSLWVAIKRRQFEKKLQKDENELTKAAIQLHHTFIESNICNEIFSYLEEPDEIVPIAIDDCVLGIDGLAGVVKILNKQKASVDKHIEHLTQKQRKNKERLTRLDKISSQMKEGKGWQNFFLRLKKKKLEDKTCLDMSLQDEIDIQYIKQY